jgi:hypothetical protein
MLSRDARAVTVSHSTVVHGWAIGRGAEVGRWGEVSPIAAGWKEIDVI